MKKAIVFGLVFLGFVSFFLLQKVSFEYAEQIQIAKSKSEVFNRINDPKNWKPWLGVKREKDNWAVGSDGSPNSGEGAKARVVSTDGILRAVATIVESIPDNLVKVKVSFNEGAATTDVYFTFNIKGVNNSTIVESIASGHDRRLAGRMFAGILKSSLGLLKNTVEN